MAAGATGGHIMPALTVAKLLESTFPGTKIVFVGTGRPAEETILGPLNYRRLNLNMTGIKGQGLGAVPGALWRAFKGLLACIDLVRTFKPHLGLVTGGYVAGPAGLAVKLSGTPLILHEQNSLPGLTNRLLGNIADLILVAFPEAKEKFSQKKTRLVGNPVRPEIISLGDENRDFTAEPLVILILGGSQGSKKLNQAAMALAEFLLKCGIKFKLIHQTGTAMEEEVKATYRRLEIEAQVGAFFPDMENIYRSSHLAVTRAGALTIFELAAARVPAILVPLPTAADDHQTLNACALAKTGAAEVVEEKHLELLNETVQSIIQVPGRLQAMHQAGVGALKAMGEQDPDQIVRLLVSLVRSN
jgi:UDP-N-acetylglucosamine--N-acetylmuramyl-(pentapeptide) pyrophosphoryl-undecaprenol N-acetylglucosamine transferase